MDQPQLALVAIKHSEEIGRWFLAPGVYSLGHSAECSISLQEEGVESEHAQLSIQEDGTILLDASGHHVTLDGEPVRGSVPLQYDQAIRIGTISLIIQREGTDFVSLDHDEEKELLHEFHHGEKYVIEKEIARGGMGSVLLARQRTIRRSVAMKVSLGGAEEEPHQRLRFVEEAQITGQLEHPNIVPVHDAGLDAEGRLFYTMKLVKGITLKMVVQLLKKGEAPARRKYSLANLLTIFQKVCDAVAFAHAKGVIHRDLKPENIMVGSFGEVLVMDWGLAKQVRKNFAAEPEGAVNGEMILGDALGSSRADEGHAYATMDGSIMGTPAYMAPEQARGEVDKLDARADIYSLGAILYELLTLEFAFKKKHDRAALLTRLRQKAPNAGPPPAGLKATDPRSLSHLPGGKVPESLAAVTMRALAFKPEERYPTVKALQDDLKFYQEGFATAAEHANAWTQFTLWIKRNKPLAVAVGFSVLVLLIVSAGFTRRLIVERNHAIDARLRAEKALSDLKGTAPTFYQQARALLDESKFDQALDKISYAIELQPSNADYYLFRANLKEAMQRLEAAEEDYRKVLQLRPGDAVAALNLALCGELLTAGATSVASQKRLLASLIEQKRLVEAGPLNATMERDGAIAQAALLGRLREYVNQLGWRTNRVLRLPDGSFKVDLSKLALGDLASLKDQPITDLDVTDCGVGTLESLRGFPLIALQFGGATATDLSPLTGMQLKFLRFSGSKGISDLSPLRGMPLQTIMADVSGVTDLAPLRGMPLIYLGVTNCREVADLSPLADCTALQTLKIANTAVADLSPLAGLRLTYLDLSLSAVRDLSALRGQPLRVIMMQGTLISDVSPLAESRLLEELTLSETVSNVEVLRTLPKLRLLSKRSFQGHPVQPVAEFWAEYDARKAKGNK